MRREMQTITVEKARLLATLTENRDKHRAVFLEAQDAYRAKVIEILDQRLEDAREGRKIDLFFRMPEPVDYTSEFDQAIAMVEWAQGDTIDLTHVDFQQYVLNEWGWSSNFAASTQSYIGSKNSAG
jgi:hypothetical protein